MLTKESRKLGGIAAAKVVKQKHLDAYLSNPNRCLFCNKLILVKGNQKVSEVKKKKFCNHSCSSSYSNQKRFKTKKNRACRECGGVIHRHAKLLCRKCIDNKFLQTTKGELKSRRNSYQSFRSSVRNHAQKVFEESGQRAECIVCSYTQHIDVAHIRAVSDFPDEATFKEINSLDNLVALCPNHHWEFDHGVLKLDNYLKN